MAVDMLVNVNFNYYYYFLILSLNATLVIFNLLLVLALFNRRKVERRNIVCAHLFACISDMRNF